MLKILQVRLQQYMNHELPDVQAGFRKGRGPRKEQGVSASEYVTLTDKWYEEIDRPWKKKKKAK